MNRLDALAKHGISVGYDTKWVGEPGTPERRQENLETIRGVYLALTPEEWCDMAMRDGDEYVGGCCGNTGVIQDIINAVFRDSGWIEADDFLDLGLQAQGHEGFECFSPLTDEQFSERLDQWAKLSPWDKIGLIYGAVEDKLRPKAYDAPAVEKDPARVLQGALTRASWDKTFSNNQESEDDKTHAANRLVTLASALQPCRDLLAQLEQASEVFSGYALVDPESKEVLSARMGLCLYSSREEAERIQEVWQRVNAAPTEISSVTVDTVNGIQLTSS